MLNKPKIEEPLKNELRQRFIEKMAQRQAMLADFKKEDFL